MLDKLYLQQKLDVVRNVRDVPKGIASSVMALNDLRNTLAHRANLNDVPKNRRLYKGKYDVFTKVGLKRLHDDMWEVNEVFEPELSRWSLELVKAQRRELKAGIRRKRS